MDDKLDEITIHTGMHKSGSTSIQDVCAQDRSLLTSIGVHYPASLLDTYPRQHSHLSFLLKQGRFEEAEQAIATAAARARDAGARRVFLSGEEFCALAPPLVGQFAEICDRYFMAKRFVFVARGRRSHVLSSYKHFLRYARPMTERGFLESFRFSPKASIETWRAKFSLDALFLRYEDMSHDLIGCFFREVFGLDVSKTQFSNVSIDYLTLLVFNTFLKEWPSEEINKVIWRVCAEHKDPMTFDIENRVVAGLIADMADSDWMPIEYQGARSLLAGEDSQETHHDPVAVCDKMISLFTELRGHFKSRSGSDEA